MLVQHKNEKMKRTLQMFVIFRDSFTRSESRMLFYGIGHNILKPHTNELHIFGRYFVLHEVNPTCGGI